VVSSLKVVLPDCRMVRAPRLRVGRWSGTGGSCGQLQEDLGARVGMVAGVGGAAVSAADRGHDGQAQAGAGTGAGGVRAGEPVEGVGQEVGREAGPWSRTDRTT